MYEIIYNSQGEKKGIKKGNLFIPISEDNRHYKQYLIDVENGVEVIDNPPSTADILAVKKEQKINEIDNKTSQLIESGFTWNNILFSFSKNAQLNWLGLLNIKSTLTYPYEIGKKEGGSYNIQDGTEMDYFLNSAIVHKESHIATGRAMQNQVLDCTTIEQLNSIVDNR